MRRVKLESKTFVSGGNVQIPCKAIPTGFKLLGFSLRLALAFTTGAAAALIPGSNLFRLFSVIDITRPGAFAAQRYTGAFLFYLNWIMKGRTPQIPASIPATNASVFNREIVLWIPFEDPSAWSPDDCTQPSESFGGSTNISIDFATWSALGAGTWDTLSGVAGTLRAEAICIPNDATVGADLKQGYFDWTGQTPLAEGGAYEYLFLYNEDMSAITSAEVSSVQVMADGKTLIDALQTQEIVGLFDRYRAVGGDPLTDSATAPQGGEQVGDEPGVGAGAGATVTFPFIPILFPRNGYKITQCPDVESSLSLQMTGSDTAFRFGYRKRNHRTEATAKAAASSVLGTPASAIEHKTESKLPLSPFKSRIAGALPFRAK